MYFLIGQTYLQKMHEADLYLRWEKCLGGWQMGGCVPILCAGSRERGTTAAGAPFYATGYCKSNVKYYHYFNFSDSRSIFCCVILIFCSIVHVNDTEDKWFIFKMKKWTLICLYKPLCNDLTGLMSSDLPTTN